MTFSVRLASNEKPRLAARADAGKQHEAPNHLREFCQGISFGLGLLVAMAVAFWIISAVAGGFPSLQSLQSYWFALR